MKKIKLKNIIIAGYLLIFFVSYTYAKNNFFAVYSLTTVLYTVAIILLNINSILALAGNYNFAIGNLDKAEEFYKALIKKNSKNALVYLNYGILLSRRNEVDEAIKNLELAKKYNADPLTDKNISQTIATTFWLSGDVKKAIVTLENIMDKYSYASPNLLTTLGYMYFLEGDMEKAKQLSLDAISEQENYASAWDNLGQIYFKENKLEESEEYFNKAVEINPNQSDSLYHLGLIYESKNQPEKAMEYFSRINIQSITAFDTVKKENVIQKLNDKA